MYIRSPYPDPPPLPEVNAHYIFYKRPDQAEWPNYTMHVNPITGERKMFKDHLREIEDLSTALAAPLSEGGMALESWNEQDRAEVVGKPGESKKEIVGIMGENSSVSRCIFHLRRTE